MLTPPTPRGSLREAFTIITREKTLVLQENRRLRELLLAHGISCDVPAATPAAAPTAPVNYDELGIAFVLA